MAKRGKEKPVAESRRVLSKREREQRQIRFLIIGTIVLALLVVGVLAFGLYQEYIAKPAQPIAIVNGTVISVRDYQAMVRYRRFENASYIAQLQAQLSQFDPSDENQQFLISYFQQKIQEVRSEATNLPMTVLDELIDNEIIRQEAARRQISVSPDEVQREIELQFGYDANPPTPTPTPVATAVDITPTPRPTESPVTREEFEQRYQTTMAAIQKNTGLTEAQFRALFEISLLTQRVREAIQSEVPTSEEQIHAYHILVETEEEAKAVLSRLQSGEDFAALAKELSKDTGSAEKGGDLGWFPRGVMVEPFEEAAFALQPGQISEPVKTDFGYHVIKVVERDSNRPLEPEMLETKRGEAWQKWLETQRTSEGVKRYWSSDKVPPSQEGS